MNNILRFPFWKTRKQEKRKQTLEELEEKVLKSRMELDQACIGIMDLANEVYARQEK